MTKSAAPPIDAPIAADAPEERPLVWVEGVVDCVGCGDDVFVEVAVEVAKGD